MRPTTAQCRVLTCGQSTHAVALYTNNKRTRVTSKLALWFFIHSRTALVLRGVAQLGFQPSCTRIPCAIDNKKDLSTSKLVSSPLLLSEPLIYVRAVSCPDRKSVHTRCRALCSFIKKHRNSSKLDSCVLYSFAHCTCSPRLLWLLADVCKDTTIYIEDVSVNCI